MIPPPALQNTSAIVQLYTDVKAYFATLPAAPGTSVVFGFEERTKQINEGTGGANRVCIIPGKVPNGEDGLLEGTTIGGDQINADQSTQPRAIFGQQRIVTFSMWAADQTTVDYVQQQQLIEQLFEWVIQAVEQSSAGHANAVWAAAPRYNRNPNERRFGLEYLAELELETQWFDALPVAVFPAAGQVKRGTAHS